MINLLRKLTKIIKTILVYITVITPLLYVLSNLYLIQYTTRWFGNFMNENFITKILLVLIIVAGAVWLFAVYKMVNTWCRIIISIRNKIKKGKENYARKRKTQIG